ncbi:MAG: ATP-binding protein [Bacteroidales bacterium]
MDRYIKKLISEGENQKLDFKYCISDSRKIARTLAAFSNSNGGKLLIGVRDNGAIAGIRSEEEYYMIETAALLYCKPEIHFTVRQHDIDGKTILEVDVEKGLERPYKARDEDDRWKVYCRQHDQNIVINRVVSEAWRKSESTKGVLIRFGLPEKALMDYLKINETITVAGFRKIAGIPFFKAEKIIINLLACGVLDWVSTSTGIRYKLRKVNLVT